MSRSVSISFLPLSFMRILTPVSGILTALEDAVLRMYGKRAVQRRLKELHRIGDYEETTIMDLHLRPRQGQSFSWGAYSYPSSSTGRFLEASEALKLIAPI